MKAAEMEALKLTGVDSVDHMKHGSEHRGSLAALLSGAFRPEYESPLHLAEHALVQLGLDLCILGELLASGTDIVPDILGDYVRGLHCRATMAAEASRRFARDCALQLVRAPSRNDRHQGITRPPKSDLGRA